MKTLKEKVMKAQNAAKETLDSSIKDRNLVYFTKYSQGLMDAYTHVLEWIKEEDEWVNIGPTIKEHHERGELAPRDVYSIVNHSNYKGLIGWIKLIGVMRDANKKRKEAEQLIKKINKTK